MGDSAGPRQALVVDAGKVYPDGTMIDAAFELPAEPARTVVLFGPSGAGKTTVLRLIAGLERPSRGFIRYGPDSWSAAGARRQTSPQNRHVGYLVQDYALFPHLTVEGNLTYGLGGLSGRDRKTRAVRIAEQLGLEGLLARRPGQLSGGQQQRVALGRALVRQPRFVMLDEPFAALDEATREEVRSYVGRLLREMAIPAIVVTHDWVDALTLGDALVVMKHGKVLQQGAPRDVLTRPADPDVAAIVGVETVVAGRVEQRSGGVARLRVGPASLVALDPGGAADAFWVCIRGEDVTVATGAGSDSSARNRLPGRVVEMHPRGALTKVVMDVGFPLVALITRRAAIDLDLGAGMPVSAVFKASIVHLVPRTRAA